MNRNVRLAVYVMVALAVVCLSLVGPGAWATPLQSPHGQTVPTRTPEEPPPTAVPPPDTAVPPPDTDDSPPDTAVPPTDTAVPPPATAVPPSATAVPTVAPAATLRPVPTKTPQAAKLLLGMKADRDRAWAGVPILFTLTLVNEGAASAQEVALMDELPQGLAPGEIVSGQGVAWQGRTLRAQVPVVPPGGRVVIVFSAVVQESTTPGSVIENRAVASAKGGLSAEGSVKIALPPAELPPTGGTASSATG